MGRTHGAAEAGAVRAGEGPAAGEGSRPCLGDVRGTPSRDLQDSNLNCEYSLESYALMISNCIYKNIVNTFDQFIFAERVIVVWAVSLNSIKALYPSFPTLFALWDPTNRPFR